MGLDGVSLQINNLDPTFSSDGLQTTDFGSGRNDTARAVAVQSDGKIVAAGYSTSAGHNDVAVARYNADGTLDTTFNGTGKVTSDFSGEEAINGVAIQTDGKILVSGYITLAGNDDFLLVRYNADGSLDTGFGTGGKAITPIGSGSDIGRKVAIQSDGKIVVAGCSFNGSNNDFAVVRYTTTGSLDTSFNVTGKVTTPIGNDADSPYGLAIQGDGKIVVAGSSYNGSNNDFALARYNANGTLDTSFNGNGKLTTAIGSGEDHAVSPVIQTDGKIVVAGDSYNGSKYTFAVARYHANGTLDTTFNGTGIVKTVIAEGDDYPEQTAIQADGKIVVAGSSFNGSNYDFTLVRYNSDGTLDTTFNGTGKVMTGIGSGDDQARAIALQSDGRIVLAGYSYNGSNTDFAVARYLPDATTGVPTLTAPASSTLTRNPVTVIFTLPETALAGSVTLTFTGSVTRVLTLAASQQTSGAHILFFDPANPTASAQIASGTPLPDGTYTVTLSYQDQYANQAATASSTGVVLDTTPPTFSPVTIASSNANPAWARLGDTVTVSFTVSEPIQTPSVTLFGGSVALVNPSGIVNPSGNNWTATATVSAATAQGTAAFSIAASDLAGNPSVVTTATTNGSSVKVDKTAPALNLPANINAEASSAAGATVPFVLSPTDNLDPSPSFVTAPTSGNNFPLGINPVNVTASDAAGNSSSGSFIVTVRDTTAPVISGTFTPLTITTGLGGTAPLPNYLPQATITDAVGVTTVAQSLPAGTPLGVGLIGIGIAASDAAGNIGTTAFAVTVVDGTAPVLFLPTNDTFEATSAAGVVVTFSVTALDNVTLNPTITTTPASGGTFPLGTTTVNVTATDAVGNSSGGSFTVTVVDTTAPTLTVPSNITLQAQSISGAVVTFTPTATDAVGVTSLVSVPASGSIFPVGTTPVHVTAMDVAGNTSTASFTVTVTSSPGDLDVSFDTDGKVTTAIGGGDDFGQKMAVQSDGKILVAGYSSNGGDIDFALVRYNADGMLDTTFNGTGKVTTAIGSGDDAGESVAVQSDGKILVGGYSRSVIGKNEFALVRYQTDGTLDSSFNSTGIVTTAIGSADSNSYSIAVQSDGKILLAGDTDNGPSNQDFAVVRYNTDGTLDASFNGTGIVTTAISTGNDASRCMVVQSDGKILLAGNSFNGVKFDVALVRYNANGSLDNTFDGDGKATLSITGDDDLSSMALQSDGKIVVAGQASIGGNENFALARFNADGSLDGSFNGMGWVRTPIGTRGDRANAVVVQNDGRIVAGGSSRVGGGRKFAVVRYNPDGTLDTTFGSLGKIVFTVGNLDDLLASLALQNSGKIMAAGWSYNGSDYDFAVARLLGGPNELLVDGGFESNEAFGDGLPLVFGDWRNEQASAVAEENGIAPYEGLRMLRFDGTEASGAGLDDRCVVLQYVPMAAYAADIAGPGLRVEVSGRFNRVATTESEFRIELTGYNGTPSNPGAVTVTRSQTLTSDEFPDSWELLSNFIDLPPGTTMVAVAVIARENITNNVSPPEFDGNYGDDFKMTVAVIDITPPILTVPPNITVEAPTNAGAVVTFTPTATDNAAVTSLVSTPASGSLFPIGTTTVTVIASDAGGNAANGSFTVTVTPPTPLGVWRYAHFGTTANSGSAANTADFDSDGVINLFEFAFGTDPTVVQSGAITISGAEIVQRGTPVVWMQNTATGVDHRALFGRRQNYAAAGLSYRVQFSADMLTWEYSEAIPTVLATDFEMEAVTVPYPFFLSTGGKAQFFRVVVTAP